MLGAIIFDVFMELATTAIMPPTHGYFDDAKAIAKFNASYQQPQTSLKVSSVSPLIINELQPRRYTAPAIGSYWNEGSASWRN
jgi:hypothetical protein